MAVVVFHHNDLDGYGAAAVIAHAVHADCMEVIFIPCNYDDKPVDIDRIPADRSGEIDMVYIVDLSFTPETSHKLLEIGSAYRTVWIDHHTSSINLMKDKDFVKEIYRLDIDREISTRYSGAYLTWQYLHEDDPIPTVVTYIDDYDRWVLAHEESTYLEIAFEMNDDDEFTNPESKIWYNLLSNNDDVLCGVLDHGALIKHYLNKRYEKELKQYGYEGEIDGHKCICLNNKANSWIFSDAYEKYPVCVSYRYNGKKYIYSIYSHPKFKNEVDCSKIAEKYGGGGHVGAAGFVSDTIIV